MAIFPKIQSPCPFKSRLSEIMAGDTCRLCQRQVHDISGLSDAERVAFFDGCSEEVCVSYKFPLRPAIAAALTVAALGAPMAAAAQEVSVEEEQIIVGGITDPGNVEFVADPRDDAVPELPIVHESGEEKAVSENPPSVVAPNLGHGVETD